MGLFTKKDPCAICGGKVTGLFPWKVEGQLVCSGCHGDVDLPDNMESGMSLADFQQYRLFREENQRLRADFTVSESIDFGIFDTKILFDFEHRRFCFDKNLGKTIFEGSQLVSFTVKEDASLLCRGSAEGLARYESRVPERVMAMAPQISQYIMQREMQEAMERMASRDRDGGGRPDGPRPMHRTLDIPEPFNRFNVELLFDHPYWRVMQCDMNGPTFDSFRPDVNEYLMDYSNALQEIEALVQALMAVAFPGAGDTSAPQADAAAAPAQSAGASSDPVEEIKKYKALLSEGIITEEEFTAKKRQIMGL